MHQVNKVILLFFICCTIVNSAIGQWNDFPAPKLSHITYDKSDKKYGVRYYLPVHVASLLDSIGRYIKVKNKNSDYFIELVVKGDTVDLYGHRIVEGFRALKKKDAVRLLLNATHRYILINSRRVPIYFDTDIRFGFSDFAYSDYSFYIRFTGRKLEDGKIIEWGNRM